MILLFFLIIKGANKKKLGKLILDFRVRIIFWSELSLVLFLISKVTNEKKD